MILHIEVTQADIDMARIMHTYSSYTRCPLAVAISRAVGHPVGVGMEFAHFQPHEGIFQADMKKLPDRAIEWRQAFDFKEEVSPITFDLEVPDP